MSKPTILYIAYMADKPDYEVYFDAMAEELDRRYGVQFVGLNLRWQRDEYWPKTALLHIKDAMLSRKVVRMLPGFLKYEDRQAPDWRLSAELARGFKPVGDFNDVEQGAFLMKMEEALEKYRPKLMLVGHQFSYYSVHAIRLAEKYNIPLAYDHAGVLPGTMCQEFEGQMAESWIGRRPEEFKRLPVDQEDLERADAYCRHYRGITRTRHEQEDNEELAQRMAEARQRGQKIIFYAGSNDYMGGMSPASMPMARWHSPYAESTEHGLNLLHAYCREHNHHLVFKPHPLTDTRYLDAMEQDGHLSFGKTANIYELIDHSDLTVTILSQVVYLAALRGKATLMMGRNQIIGSGACYEALSEADLEPAMTDALQNGWTGEMKGNFRQHVARLLKYYLFHWHEGTEAFCLRGPKEAAAMLVEKMSEETTPFKRGLRRRLHTAFVHHPAFMLSQVLRLFMPKEKTE